MPPTIPVKVPAGGGARPNPLCPPQTTPPLLLIPPPGYSPKPTALKMPGGAPCSLTSPQHAAVPSVLIAQLTKRSDSRAPATAPAGAAAIEAPAFPVGGAAE